MSQYQHEELDCLLCEAGEPLEHSLEARTDLAMNIQTCLDCNAYDDADQVDSFMRPFGDNAWICDLCAESRGIVA